MIQSITMNQALFLAVATVSILWYVVKKIFPDEIKDLQFFLTFNLVIVPFVMLICFGWAVINYDAIAARSGWPVVLPLNGLLSPPIVGGLVFYIGQTVWLSLGWRKLRKPRLTADRGDIARLSELLRQ